MFFYLPALIALSMAFIIILDPRIYEIVLVGLSIFFLGEAFFGIYVVTGEGLKYPIAFLRVYSLTLLAIFVYYLYNKETIIRKRLDELNKRLEELGKLKSNLVVNVSHELRTPLTSIKNAAFLLKKKKNGQEEGTSISDEELLDIVITNANRQSKLIDDFLDLAKIEKGKPSSARSLVDIGKIAQEVIKSLGTQVASKNIEVIVDIQPDLPKIYVSEGQIVEVYVNLLDNSIKYNKVNGKIILQISVDDSNVKSILEDTGRGILPEDLDKLFSKFGSFGDVWGDRKKGIGLGLAITKEIIELHGGKIWVESKSGAGSKFIFTLPIGLRKEDRGLSENAK